MARSGLLRFAIGALGAIGLAVLPLFALSPAGQASAQTPTGTRMICFNGQTLQVQQSQLGQYTGYTSGPCQNGSQGPNGCNEPATSTVQRTNCEPRCNEQTAMNFGEPGKCEREKCRDRDAINFDEHGKCEFDDDEDDEDDENDENDEDDESDEVIVIVRQVPVIVPQPVIVERQVVVEQQPVIVEQPVVVQRTVVQEAQGGGTTSVVAPATITAPSTGDGGLADPHHNAASAAGASVAQALGIVLGSFGVVALYSYFARRAHRN